MKNKNRTHLEWPIRQTAREEGAQAGSALCFFGVPTQDSRFVMCVSGRCCWLVVARRRWLSRVVVHATLCLCADSPSIRRLLELVAPRSPAFGRVLCTILQITTTARHDKRVEP